MKSKTLNSQIYAEASQWLIEFRSGDIDVKGRKDFHSWLSASPEHIRAYLELAAIWNEGTGLDPNRMFDDVRLMGDIQPENNIAPLQISASRSDLYHLSAAFSRLSKPRWVTLATSLVVMFVGAGVWLGYARNTYATSVGQISTLTLSDGSTVELDSNSRLHLEFSQGVREVQLLEGQALFHVAKDFSRPFVVRTDNARIRAVGTQFDVYRNRAATTVTVVEGTVSVLPVGSEADSHVESNAGVAQPSPFFERNLAFRSLILTAGDQVTVAPAVQPKSIKADVTTATAWTQHELVFKGTPLEDVVVEFNRYNRRRLTIRDDGIANLKVTGIFSSTDPSSLLRFLEARRDIAVTEAGDEILITQKP